jgi:hypothetical protein
LKNNIAIKAIANTANHSILVQLSNHIIVIITSFLAALIGGLVTGYFSIRQVKIAHQNNLEIKRLEDENIINNLKRGIYQEIKTIWDSYYVKDNDKQSVSVGEIIDKLDNPSSDFENDIKNAETLLNKDIKENPLLIVSIETYNEIAKLISESPRFVFNYYYPLSQNYFIIYEQNAKLIGGIKDYNLSSLIIECYVLMKGLVDSFGLNNALVSRLENAQLLFNKTHSKEDAKVVLSLIKSLYNYSNQLKSAQKKIKTKMIVSENSLLKLLERDFKSDKVNN